MCGSVSEVVYSNPSPPSVPSKPKSTTTFKQAKPAPKKAAPAPKKGKMEFTKKFISNTLQAAVKKIQRSNTWTSGQNVLNVTDRSGKTRNAFCARGAVCAVLGDIREIETTQESKTYKAVEKELLKTYSKKPTAYHKAGVLAFSLVTVNDGNSHSNVVKLFRDTIDRLG